MEGDGDEEDEEGGPDGDRKGHADEDAVEEDARFKEEALQEHLLLELGGRELGRGVRVGGGVEVRLWGRTRRGPGRSCYRSLL